MTDLLVHDQDLILATMGRGIWVLDDLSPLRQAAAIAAQARASVRTRTGDAGPQSEQGHAAAARGRR